MSKKKRRRHVVEAALQLAEDKPWSEITLADIAEKAEVALPALREDFHSKNEILAAFTRMIDDAVMEKREPAEDESHRERLFDVIMLRFEAMAPYKKALKAIYDDMKRHPSLSLSLPRALCESQYWMLTTAGITAEGGRGLLRVPGLMAIYASVLPIWLEDDDPGLAKTMAALDRRLTRAERWVSYVEGVGRQGSRFLCALVPPVCGSAWRSRGKDADAPVTPVTDGAPPPETPPLAEPTNGN